MTPTTSAAAPARNSQQPAPAWRVYPGKTVIVHTLDGSYADKRAVSHLREAEHAVEALQKLLEQPTDRAGAGTPSIPIYLVDPIAAAEPAQGLSGLPSRDEVSGAAIVRVVQPEAPGEPLAYPIVHLLVARWLGERAVSAHAFIRGIAGVVAARTNAGPPIEEANHRVRAELAAGRTVSIFRPARGVTTPDVDRSADAGDNDRAYTSFVAFVLEQFGGKALRQFLKEYDPRRTDQSAQAAFRLSLGKAEEAWLAEVRRPPHTASPFVAFLRQIGPLLRPHWVRAAEVLAYMLFGLGFSLAMPLASKYLVDDIIPGRDAGRLVTFILVLLVAYVLNALLGMRRAHINSWINQQVLSDLQERMFAHLQRLPHAYYARSKVGDIMSRMSNDLSVVQGAITQVATTLIYMTLSALGAAIALVALSPLLGALVLVVLPLFAVSYLGLRTRLQRASYEMQRIEGEITTGIEENLSAHAIIKALGLERLSMEGFHAQLLKLTRASLRLVTIGSLFDISTGLAVTVGQLLILGVGGYLVLAGQLTIGTLLAFFGFLPSLFTPVGALASLGQTVQLASGSMDRVNELLDEPVSIADKTGAIELPPLSHGIVLQNLTFGYGADQAILREVNITVPAGSHVAIVGPSGAGKSTIVNLLARFWDPDMGQVLFDGHDLRDVTLASLRDQIGLVFQDTFVFDTTLRENISVARPGATDEEVRAAARAARLESYIEALPAGYDTVLGERGVRMSGGQRQRLAIARALLRDPRLLILDEATSALDGQTERQILDTLALLLPGRTTVSITHRLSLAATADTILVLHEGNIVEQGPHRELVTAGGLYQTLYEEQMSYATGRRRGSGRREVEAARLKAIPLLAGLGPAALADLADNAMLERYAAGEDVVTQGELGDKLYIIVRGQVDVLVRSGEGLSKVNTLNEGDYFGEMALLHSEPRSATVRTAMPSELYSVSRADFLELMHTDEIGDVVRETIATRRAALAAAASVASSAPEEPSMVPAGGGLSAGQQAVRPVIS